MIRFNQDYIDSNGGIIHSLSKKSSQYLRYLLRNKKGMPKIPVSLVKLDRTISHTHPHLDEYFADLLFRSCLPSHKLDIDFMEMGIQTKGNDLLCQAYWPNAAVFGLGSAVSSGVNPLILFDEHVQNGGRQAYSCSQLVAQDLNLGELRWPLKQLLNEVNEIDAKGGAHAQHIGNIIKTAHQVRLTFENSRTNERYQEWLTAEWKKSLMDASISAVAFCMVNSNDKLENSEEIKRSVVASLKYFADHTALKGEPSFSKVLSWMKNSYHNQKVVCSEARLSRGSQQLLLGKVCVSLEVAWGEQIARLIMMHFWEIIYHGQVCYLELLAGLSDFFKDKKDGVYQSVYGVYSGNFAVIPGMRLPGNQKGLMLIEAEPTPSMIAGNRPLGSALKVLNDGYGFVLIRDSFKCVSALFKGTKIDQDLWENLVDLLCSREQGQWHVVRNMKTGRYAPYILNGGAAHQHVVQSEIDMKSIASLLQRLTK